MEQTLYYRQGASDKVYHATIEAKDGGFVVNIAYGRRGATLQTGTKTTTPVPYEDAKRVFDKLIAEKTAKGYTPGVDGTPYQHTDKANQATDIHCQLLNPIDEIIARRCIDDPQFWMQVKHDGRRLLILKDGEVTGINRRGLVTGVPEPIAHACRNIEADFIIDGEAVGDVLHVFDILSMNGEDQRPLSYLERYLLLCRTIFWVDHPALVKVGVACTMEEKVEYLDQLRRDGAEGAVFKRVDAPYTAGRPASGGDQLKYKFVETASFLVTKVNGKRSVALSLFDGDRIVPAGNVTIAPNHEVPEPGAVVECRYLYAFRESGAIYQPVYLGARTDIPSEECVVEQLKYKAGAQEAA